MFSSSNVNIKRVTCIIILLEISLLVIKTDCLRIDGHDHDRHDEEYPPTRRPQAQSTGWRGVGSSSSSSWSSSSPIVNLKTTTLAPRPSKLVEWDDDDLNDHPNVILLPKDNHLHHQMEEDIRSPFKYQPASSSFARIKRPLSGSRPNKLNKLIFHGQIRRNETRKLIDGLHLYVNTHSPVVISRRMHQFSSRIISATTTTSTTTSTSTTTKQPTSREEEDYAITTPKSNEETLSSPKRNLADVHLDTFETNWRPLVVISRSRRFSKSSKNHTDSPDKQSRMITTTTTSGNDSLKKSNVSIDYIKWKPIFKQTTGFDGERKALESNQHEFSGKLIETKEVSMDRGQIPTRSSIGDPFDNEDLEPVTRKTQDQTTRQSVSKVDNLDAKWKPVETSTGVQDLLASPDTTTASTVTTKSPLQTTTSAASTNSSEPGAQRSASDLNYIYSQQPVVQSSGGGGGGGGGNGGSYYSNYLVPAQPQQTIEQPQIPTIIDTTSGQTPEMIVERVPDSPPQQVDSYSVPQTVSSFQPAQPLPSRQPISSSYGGYGGQSFEPQPLVGSSGVQPTSYGHGYAYGSGQQAQPTRQQAQPAPVVRQEHHYHYYNSQRQSPQAERQQTSVQQPATSGGGQTVIRELQPIMITQPLIQQQPASTTPAPSPQIIREIVREVPMQTIQVQQQPQLVPQIQRIVVPQPIAIPMPVQMSRDFGDHSTTARLMRQLSNTMPQVAIRMPPALSQFRLQMAAAAAPLQLPLRLGPQQNQAPVTRQTGSFVIPPMPKKTTTFLTETQVMPSHTTIMQTTQFTPATRTTVYTTDHQVPAPVASRDVSGPPIY